MTRVAEETGEPVPVAARTGSDLFMVASVDAPAEDRISLGGRTIGRE